MNEEQFFYWLKGLADTSGVPNKAQWDTILKELDAIGGKAKRLEASRATPLTPYRGPLTPYCGVAPFLLT